MNSPRFLRLLLALVATLAALLASGCSTVQPWERATLSDATMNPNRDPLQLAANEHIYFSREASTGGRTVGGSGCGCN